MYRFFLTIFITILRIAVVFLNKRFLQKTKKEELAKDAVLVDISKEYIEAKSLD
ncbi:MAG: hypothetical protein K1060chlam5_00169 [Candidatus Anoxychlamydiales bacterium]|nr:hypothetical protein [Candidatus Anoxychlamydiales bacterium]